MAEGITAVELPAFDRQGMTRQSLLDPEAPGVSAGRILGGCGVGVVTLPDHARCVGCGARHAGWPAPVDGDLCDACHDRLGDDPLAVATAAADLDTSDARGVTGHGRLA